MVGTGVRSIRGVVLRRKIYFVVGKGRKIRNTLYMRIPVVDNQWVILDDDDYDDVSAYVWQAGTRQYAYAHGYHVACRKDHHNIRLHRLIMNVGKGDKRVVHHINGDTFDNRKSNLMIMGRSEHCRLLQNK